MKTTICLFIALVSPAVAWSQDGPAGPGLSRAETVRATRALVRWFECEECEEGELPAVTRYGRHVVPSLIAALQQGPSPASRELLRRELLARYEELARQSQENPEAKLASGREEFVAHYLGQLEAQYRIRAAQGLAAIKDPKVKPALQAALARATRGDVKSAIEQSLATVD